MPSAVSHRNAVMKFVFMIYVQWQFLGKNVHANTRCGADILFSEITHGKALVQHNYKAIQPVIDDNGCQFHCFLDDRCISYNFDGQQQICNLSDSDHVMHPKDLIDRTNIIYRRVENNCGCTTNSNSCWINFNSHTHRCTCKPGFDGEKCEIAVTENCAELLKAGYKRSGVYTVYPDSIWREFKVYCDQKTAGGGWTVFQKRQDGSVDFNLEWNDYKNGFGNPSGEVWLGLDKIHRLTSQTRNQLRVELEDFDGQTAYAEYDFFAVKDEPNKYSMSLGTYTGTAGDSLSNHSSMPFTTKDRDNDRNSQSNCATTYSSGWWFNDCHQSNLNGQYHNGKHTSFANGVNWYHWKGYHYSARRAEMKIRPVSDVPTNTP